MAFVNKIRSWTSVILHLCSQEIYILMKVIMKCVNIKLWDILGCFHYILNAPRISNNVNFMLWTKKKINITKGKNSYIMQKRSMVLVHCTSPNQWSFKLIPLTVFVFCSGMKNNKGQ